MYSGFAEIAQGIGDREILGIAQRDGRVVVTADRDFGALAFGFRLPASSGIVLLRLTPLSPEAVVQRVIESMSSAGDWVTVLEPDRVRARPLPIKEPDRDS